MSWYLCSLAKAGRVGTSDHHCALHGTLNPVMASSGNSSMEAEREEFLPNCQGGKKNTFA